MKNTIIALTGLITLAFAFSATATNPVIVDEPEPCVWCAARGAILPEDPAPPPGSDEDYHAARDQTPDDGENGGGGNGGGGGDSGAAR